MGFNPGPDDKVSSLAVQADERILVGGKFTKLAGGMRNGLGRVNPDGSLDVGFTGQPGGSMTAVSTLAVQADGRILVGGRFDTLAGQTNANIGRLNADGTADREFSSGVSGGLVDVVVVQPDGKILVGGTFNMLGGQPRLALGRLNNTWPAVDYLLLHGHNVTWYRVGGGPEAWRAALDYSTDGVNWTGFGPGVRIANGWRWSQSAAASLPSNAVVLRARGFVPGAGLSEWYVQRSLGLPALFADNISFGLQSGQLGFSVGGAPGQTVVVEVSSNLRDWTAVATNTISSDACFYFSEPVWQSRLPRFYRVKPAVR